MTTACTSYWCFERNASESRLLCEKCDAIDTHVRPNNVWDLLRLVWAARIVFSIDCHRRNLRYLFNKQLHCVWMSAISIADANDVNKNSPQNSFACIIFVIVSMRLSAILVACLCFHVNANNAPEFACVESKAVSAYRHRNRWHIFGFGQSVQKIKGPLCRQMRYRIAIHSPAEATYSHTRVHFRRNNVAIRWLPVVCTQTHRSRSQEKGKQFHWNCKGTSR